jgi:hypothetical protein
MNGAQHWFLVGAGLALAAAVAGGDVPYVTVEGVGLYAEAKLVATLAAGEIIEAEPHGWNDNLLRVKYGGQECLAQRKSFQSQAEVVDGIREARAEAEGRLQGLNQQAELLCAKQQELYRALLQVQHDNALAYKLRAAGIRVEGPNITIGDTGVQGDYVEVLPDQRAEKLLKDWRAELAGVTGKLAALNKGRLDDVRRIFRGEQDREYYVDLFARWEQTGRNAPLTVYEVTGRNARLYLKQNPVVTLNPGDFIRARPHPENRAVIVATYDGRSVTGQMQDFVTWRDHWRALLDARLEREDAVRRLENEIKMTAYRMKLYISLCADLKYRSAQKADYVLIPEITVRPGTGAPIEIELPADQLLVYALRIRKGQELLDQWTKDVKQLEDDLYARTKDLAAAKKALAAAERDGARAKAAFDAFIGKPPPPAAGDR